MNVIFQCGDDLGAVTNDIKADTHKHWMLQLFLGLEDALEIVVEGNSIQGKCVVVDMDTMHQFSTAGQTHFTMLIDPVSPLARQLHRGHLKQERFYILPDDQTRILHNGLAELLTHIMPQTLGAFIEKIYEAFSLAAIPEFDERIVHVLKLLKQHVWDEKNEMACMAQMVSLSQSRFAHLFKEETGVPLKSYMVLHRLQKAYAVMSEGGNITNAAMVAGFDTPSHLAYTNRKMTGMSARGIIKDSEFLKVSLK